MNLNLKKKSRLIAATGTFLIHVLLFGLLMLDFSGENSSALSYKDLENFDLNLEELAAEDMFMSPPGKDPLSQQKDKASESLSKDKGHSKIQPASVPLAQPTTEEPQPVVDPADTIVKKIEVVKVLKPDTIKTQLEKDSVAIAHILDKMQQAPPKDTGSDRYKKERERYQFYKNNYRTIINFKKVYPYALKTRELIESVNEQLSKMTSESEKKKLIKETEKKLFHDYETAVRTMTVSQGKLLLKLIARETNKTGYEIIKDYKGKFGASFWYGVGKLFGTDLKTEFHKEREDSLIENVLNKYNNADLY